MYRFVVRCTAGAYLASLCFCFTFVSCKHQAHGIKLYLGRFLCFGFCRSCR